VLLFECLNSSLFVQRKVEEGLEVSRTQAEELTQLRQQSQGTRPDSAAAEEARRQLDQLKAENSSLSELLSEQKRLVHEHSAEASTAVVEVRGLAQGQGGLAAAESGSGLAEVGHWKKQVLELAAENAELKNQLGVAETGAIEARQVSTRLSELQSSWSRLQAPNQCFRE